ATLARRTAGGSRYSVAGNQRQASVERSSGPPGAQIGRGKMRKKWRKLAGRKTSAAVPVERTNVSTQEYEAGRSLQTRKTRNSEQTTKNTWLASSFGCCRSTKRPMKKKLK